MTALPATLYRGDADPAGVRQLRQWRRGFLLTNLSNGGCGTEILLRGLAETIRHHVAGWEKTHFLSFSENLSTAMRFAKGPEEWPLVETMDNKDWDAALMTMTTSCLRDLHEVQPGLYECWFQPDPLSHSGKEDLLPYVIPRCLSLYSSPDHQVQVLLVDVVKHLSARVVGGEAGLDGVLQNAAHDTEWLILPKDAAPSIPGELTSALDISCISKFTSYSKK